jgi:hypothetical protein
MLAINSNAQDLDYAREVLNVLTSEEMHGRGYVKKGDSLAADYIAAQFNELGLLSFEGDYMQKYAFPVNTFPGKIKARIDGNKLVPGSDFVISAANPSIKGKYPLHFLPDSIDNREKLQRYLKGSEKGDVFLVSNIESRDFYGFTVEGVKGILIRTARMPWWHVSNSNKVDSTFWIKVRKELVGPGAKTISIRANNEFIDNYSTRNVVGYVKGRKQPDRFIVFTAHYDHLGMMGKDTYFPGANDNGSGTAMLLDLARHYSERKNQPDCSMAFMAFSGEEAGLYGSKYYVGHPLFDMRAIKLLVNLDMVGTGSEGITIVNGKAYKSLYDQMVEINKKKGYLSQVKDRGEACNSDHCPFYNTGIKSIFIYTMGEEHMEYHNINDSGNKLPFTAYEGLFRLLTDYVQYID